MDWKPRCTTAKILQKNHRKSTKKSTENKLNNDVYNLPPPRGHHTSREYLFIKTNPTAKIQKISIYHTHYSKNYRNIRFFNMYDSKRINIQYTNT